MMLVGAYQEVMGNNHNLFGVPHEAHVFIGEDGYIIKKVIYGATLGDAVSSVRFDPGPAARYVSQSRVAADKGRQAFKYRRQQGYRVLRRSGRKLYVSDPNGRKGN